MGIFGDTPQNATFPSERRTGEGAIRSMQYASAEALRELGIEPENEHDRTFRAFASDFQSARGKIRRVHGDGNCMFRSLADQMWRDEHRHAQIRAFVAEEMLRHPERYQADMFVPDPDDRMPPGATFGDYVRLCVARNGFWGDERCLQAFCNATGFGITLVWRTTVTKRRDIAPDPSVRRATAGHVWLFWDRDRHYDSVRV